MHKRIKKKKLSQKIDKIKKMTLDKNDTLVVECNELTSVRERSDIREYFIKMFPNNKVIVVPNGFNISIIEEIDGGLDDEYKIISVDIARQ
jgi:glycosyltransferase involved in cell wall biosynthesis